MTVMLGQEAEGTGTNLAIADGAAFGVLFTASSSAETGTGHIKFAANNTAGEIRIAVWSYNATTKLPETLLCEGHLGEHTAEKGTYPPITLEHHGLTNGEKYVLCFMPVGGNATVKQGSTVASWKSTTGGHTSFSGLSWKAQEEKGPVSIWVEPSTGQTIVIASAASTSGSSAEIKVRTPIGLNEATSQSEASCTVTTPGAVATPIPTNSAASESGSLNLALKTVLKAKIRSVKSTTAANRHEVTPASPTGLTVGDLVIMEIVAYTGEALFPEIEKPAGWERIGTEGKVEQSGKQRMSALFYKEYLGGALPTVKLATSVTTFNTYAYVACIEAGTFNPSTPIDVTSDWKREASGLLTAKMPPVTTDISNTLAMCFVSSPGTPGEPAGGWTNWAEGANTPGTNVFSKDIAAPSSTGEPTYTHTGASNETMAIMVAITSVGTVLKVQSADSQSASSMEYKVPVAVQPQASASTSESSGGRVVRIPGAVEIPVEAGASVSASSGQIKTRINIIIERVANGTAADDPELFTPAKVEPEPGQSVSGSLTAVIRAGGNIVPQMAESVSGSLIGMHAATRIALQIAESESNSEGVMKARALLQLLAAEALSGGTMPLRAKVRLQLLAAEVLSGSEISLLRIPIFDTIAPMYVDVAPLAPMRVTSERF